MKFRRKCSLVIFAVLICFVLTSGVHAQEKGERIYVVSHVDIKPDAYLPKAEEHAWTLFRAETMAIKHDEGLVSFVVLQEIGSTNHFIILETWRDRRAYDLHVGSDHTVKFRMELHQYLGAPFDSRIHNQFR